MCVSVISYTYCIYEYVYIYIYIYIICVNITCVSYIICLHMICIYHNMYILLFHGHGLPVGPAVPSFKEAAVLRLSSAVPGVQHGDQMAAAVGPLRTRHHLGGKTEPIEGPWQGRGIRWSLGKCLVFIKHKKPDLGVFRGEKKTWFIGPCFFSGLLVGLPH